MNNIWYQSFNVNKKLLLFFRAAMKMANMDAILDFMFTKPLDVDGVSQFYHCPYLYSSYNIDT